MKAFPKPVSVEFQKQDGMDLRDYFAAKALQGMLANYQWGDGATELSKASYQYADAMMKAREL